MVKNQDQEIPKASEEEYVSPDLVSHADSSTAKVPNLSYAYIWGYVADQLGVRESNVGNQYIGQYLSVHKDSFSNPPTPRGSGWR
ncbi:hypothetical protein AVEN_23969-1 [Araneus ventricosus]|uniref:Uncharacterized protein n=1 Tax=Araneus ventricosus TaxID=182803 RepID=A0A4Y2ND43_ARAVE|nr:hypothetical protein AVEN_23969-1 [Araneus ventricosus]